MFMELWLCLEHTAWPESGDTRHRQRDPKRQKASRLRLQPAYLGPGVESSLWPEQEWVWPGLTLLQPHKTSFSAFASEFCYDFPYQGC